LAKLSDLRKIYRTALGENYPEEIKVIMGEQEIRLHKTYSFRYGDNPGQPAAVYSREPFFKELKTGKQGLSKINFEDIFRAHLLLMSFDRPACAFMKHLNPSGVAVIHSNESTHEIVRKARESDSQAAFGASVGINYPCDESSAKELASTYIECVAAPSFSQEALSVFKEKKDLRVVEITLPTDTMESELHLYPQGFATLSAPYKSRIKTRNDVTVVTKKTPTESQFQDLIFSWAVCGHVRSNAIVLAKDLCTIGIGTGQQDRVTAARLAVEKAVERGHKARLVGAVAASDGYISFADNITVLAKHGISAVIQPGGSVKDEEVINECNESGIAMVFTGARCFSHF